MPARSTDPDTSHDAAASVDERFIDSKIFDCLTAHGPEGATCEEISDEMQMSRVTISPRLAPLSREGKVLRTAWRRPGSSGRNQIVWLLPDYEFLT